MSANSNIEWTDATWNPVRGCSRVSEGCRNCYAEKFAARFAGDGQPDARTKIGPSGLYKGFVKLTSEGPRWTGNVELVKKHLADPLKWRNPKRIFVNSMSDLFHESLADEEIQAIFGVMSMCGQHTFQVLTKRPERMLDFFSNPINTVTMCQADATVRDVPTHTPNRHLHRGDYRNINHHEWPLPNVWLGVSVENQATADARIPLLLRTQAAKRFVSYEPALDVVSYEAGRGYLTGESHDNAPYKGRKLDWVIVGGESGPGARPFDIQWARQTVQQCKEAGVACFVKQLGAKPIYETNANEYPLLLKDGKGGDMAEWPEDLRVREFPL